MILFSILISSNCPQYHPQLLSPPDSFAISDEEFLTSDIENEDGEDDELVVDKGMDDIGVPEELKTL